ncbi:MAG TPA: crossover junction endodeoxyribonuclease RuvC [Patescibacteria group bacterium]|nr:crossover junction endodeoxyribonuclease RuvC [Patescibacteria group bacterium]
MRILGIDPGVGRVGWGVVEKNGPKVSAIAYDCFETVSSLDLAKRLVLIYTEMNRLLTTYQPEVLAIEELFFNKNVKTAFAVGQARGVIFLAAQQSEVPLAIYTPTVVKSTVTGYGKAEKKQVGEMVKLQLHLPKIPTPDDTADALAIALTHAFTKKYV